MLFALALVPVIALLIFIYVKDKNDKEPIGLLIGLFFAGAATVITAMIAELIGTTILDAVFPYESMFKAIIFAMIVVAPAEELGKYLVLRLITWKNKKFTYSYDAIVYAVFVSLGFACVENIGYVFQGGLGTALIRMFTAVPGHACFAVFMGFFYSKAKYASIRRDKSNYSKFNALSLIVPIVLHGVYDGIVFAARASGEDIVLGLGALLWIGFVIAMFVVSVIVVSKSSKNDYCIVFVPNQGQTVYKPSFEGTWTCTCGTSNYLNFCSQCGSPRPMESSWICPTCGTLATLKFCGHCGCPRPGAPAPASAPMPGGPAPMAGGTMAGGPRPMNGQPVGMTGQPRPMNGAPMQGGPAPMAGGPMAGGPMAGGPRPMNGQPVGMAGQPRPMNGQPVPGPRPMPGQPMNNQPMYGQRPVQGGPANGSPVNGAPVNRAPEPMPGGPRYDLPMYSQPLYDRPVQTPPQQPGSGSSVPPVQ